MIRIFIADDHAIVRQGLRRLLEQEADFVVAGEAADGRQILKAAETDAWDVLVLDLSLPKVSGTSVFQLLRERRPELRIVILSAYPEDQLALRMLKAGAAAYLNKERPAEELIEAIRRAAAGRTYIPESLAEQALGRTLTARPAHETLTGREHQVFTLLVQGKSVAEIAAELNLLSSTVSNHLHKVKEKLGVKSVAEVLRYAHRVGLID
jgi:two-component system, NarL family, invasion response regulator UvrY